MRDPIAKGDRRTNYTKSLGQKKNWKVKPENQWIHVNVEPIIGDEVWAQCNQILAEQHQKQNRRPAEHLFTGIVYCHCGYKMYVPFRSPKYTCHKCHNKIPATDLESIYHEQLKTFFFSNDEISGYLNKADELINDRQNLFVTLEQESKKLKQEMDKLVRLHLDGEMPKEGFGNHYKPLEARLKQIENELPDLQGEIDYLKIQYLSSDEVLNEAKDLYERWPTLEEGEKRNIIDTITKKIIVGTDEVSINLAYMPSAAEMTTNMQHNVRVALPCYYLTLRSRKPLNPAYPEHLVTLGDHIRKRRIDLGLRKKDVARIVNATTSSVTNWEQGRSNPGLYLLPKVIKFLGYDPMPTAPTSVGEKIKAYRRKKGLSIKKFARIVGVDPTTMAGWEIGVFAPNAISLARLYRILE